MREDINSTITSKGTGENKMFTEVLPVQGLRCHRHVVFYKITRTSDLKNTSCLDVD